MRSQKPAIACECGDHVFRSLTKGYVALVSPSDAAALLETSWRAHVSRHTRYVTVLSSNGGKNILSRRVMAAAPGQLVDHINCDTTDCRRPNLRFATPSQNGANRRKSAGRNLPKGVYRRRGGYAASIRSGGRTVHLGQFSSPEAASRAYRVAATMLFDEFARFE